MVEIDEGGDPLGQQAVKDGMVESDGLLIDLARPVRDQSGPGDGGTKTVVIELLEQCDVALETIIESRGLRRAYALMEARRLNGVPVVKDVVGLAISAGGSLRLGRRAGAAPPKIVRKAIHHLLLLRLEEGGARLLPGVSSEFQGQRDILFALLFFLDNGLGLVGNQHEGDIHQGGYP
ncbi:hypothetical protein D3C73_729160 [compost metagenome]